MEKLKILLVGGLITVEHQGRLITARLRELLEATGRFEVVYTEEIRNITPEFLEPYDALFIDYDGKFFPTEHARRFGEQTEKCIYDFVAQGKGIVFYHSTVWVDHDWPDEWRKLLGGYCDMTMGGRRCPKDDHFIEIMDPDSPITKDIDAKWMNVFDDLFAPVLIHPEADVHVLASIYDDIENYKVPWWPPAHHPVEIPDGKLENLPGVNEYAPCIWTNKYGKGRVFVTSIGHWEALDRFNFITMLVRGTEWAASGEVTLERPNRSGDNRLKLFPYY
jgi:type 1 glutamine amidotransferase